jgi:hypothetical protein
VSSHKKYCQFSQAVIIKEFKAQFDVWQGASQYGNGRRNLVGARGHPGNSKQQGSLFATLIKISIPG